MSSFVTTSNGVEERDTLQPSDREIEGVTLEQILNAIQEPSPPPVDAPADFQTTLEMEAHHKTEELYGYTAKKQSIYYNVELQKRIEHQVWKLEDKNEDLDRTLKVMAPKYLSLRDCVKQRRVSTGCATISIALGSIAASIASEFTEARLLLLCGGLLLTALGCGWILFSQVFIQVPE